MTLVWNKLSACHRNSSVSLENWLISLFWLPSWKVRRHFRDKLLNLFEFIRYYGDWNCLGCAISSVNNIEFIVQNKLIENCISSSSAHEAGRLPPPGQGKVSVGLSGGKGHHPQAGKALKCPPVHIFFLSKSMYLQKLCFSSNRQGLMLMWAHN